MEYDRGDSFPFDFEPNIIPFGLKSKGKLSPRSYPIQFDNNWKHSFLSAQSQSRKLRVSRFHCLKTFVHYGTILWDGIQTHFNVHYGAIL